ncbi:8-oxo-dGTP diphosphatase [Planctomonas psychrotolerans]|uniref:8-oxo-dGTP diphosphatase n=1 Tax=Planctomonas psychrotolerans TaxID=2528712 RepID=UPI00123C78B8|nr:8-oxo-dGTP diphosphatase [Planctomonas psychrotolerans]
MTPTTEPARNPELPQVCVCYLVRRGTDGSAEVLLGRKKKGLGVGKYVAPGGKLEPGESPREAMVREVQEEVGLRVAADDLVPLGLLTYLFPTRPAWSQQSSVYTTTRWTGTPTESDELAPEWFPVGALPLESMWDDAKRWLPAALAGARVERTFTFGADESTVVEPEMNAPKAPVSG